jgi:hypothetical protein
MPDEDQLYVETPPQRVRVTISPDAIAARLAQLPTRKEMWRAVLLGVTTGAGARAVSRVAFPLIGEQN